MSVRSKRTFQSNQELWQAFLSSDKEAFACLFEEYADAMYAYGCKMTSDAELVKDAIQDVFVKLYKNRLSSCGCCEEEETRQQLLKALDELTDRQHEAIYLYYIQEIPLNELSVLLDMNYQSTRNLIHRAMTKLRQHIQPTSYASIPLLLVQYLSE